MSTVAQVIEFCRNAEAAERNEIMTALKQMGVSTRKPRVSKPKVKSEFNPDQCHARDFQCFDCEKYDSGVKHIHIGLTDFQCTRSKVDGDFCKRHIKSCRVNNCAETGELFMGLFADPRPEKPTRMSISTKPPTKHTYVWLEDTDGKYDEFLPENKPVKKSRKSTIIKPFEDIDWDQHVSSETLKSFSVAQLNVYLEFYGIEFNGKKAERISTITVHHAFENEETEDEDETEVEVEQEVPAEDETEVEQEVPAEDETEVEQEASAEDETEVEQEAPAEDETEVEQESEEEIENFSDDEDDDMTMIVIDGVDYLESEGFVYYGRVCMGISTTNPRNDWEMESKKIHGKNMMDKMMEVSS